LIIKFPKFQHVGIVKLIRAPTLTAEISLKQLFAAYAIYVVIVFVAEALCTRLGIANLTASAIGVGISFDLLMGLSGNQQNK
jgi:hypothetical protein